MNENHEIHANKYVLMTLVPNSICDNVNINQIFGKK